MRKHRSGVRASLSLATEGPGATLNSIHNLIQGTNREFEACLISSALSSHIQNLCFNPIGAGGHNQCAALFQMAISP